MANDFRGYLQKVDPYALAYTGNDAKIDPTKPGYDTNYAGIGSVLNTAGNRQRVQDYITGLYNKFLSGQGTDTVIQPGVSATGATAPVYAPRLDIAALNANARKSAENAVNPFYTKTLNDFLAGQAQEKAFQEQQTQTNIKDLQDTLANTLQTNAIAGERATADTATKLGQIGTAENQFQTDQGTATDEARIAQAREQAKRGVSGGIAAGETATAAENANTAEARQTQQFQEQRDQANLFKNRTLEDITRGNELATTAKEKGIAQANFDLDKYLKSAALQEQSKRNELEQQRLQAVASETQNQARLKFYTDYLAKITDPARYVAALQTYGGAF